MMSLFMGDSRMTLEVIMWVCIVLAAACVALFVAAVRYGKDGRFVAAMSAIVLLGFIMYAVRIGAVLGHG
jgi:Trk-type K+ transport system membrane component